MKRFITAYVLLVWLIASTVLAIIGIEYLRQYLGFKDISNLGGLCVVSVFVQLGQLIITIAAFFRAFRKEDNWFNF